VRHQTGPVDGVRTESQGGAAEAALANKSMAASKALLADLAVRVRVRASHHGTSVLKYLDPLVLSAELGGLISPLVDHSPDLVRLHERQRHVTPRVETHDLNRWGGER
jgi:hypothetical protein